MAVQKSTFMFIPQGSLWLDEPPYSWKDAVLVGETSSYFSMPAQGIDVRPKGHKIQSLRALRGIHAQMNEVHLLLVCPWYATTREHLDLVDTVWDIVQTRGEGETGYAAYLLLI